MDLRCVNHRIKKAAARCRRCGDGLCFDCILQAPDGTTYCSRKCLTEFKEFQGTITDEFRPRTKFTIIGLIKGLLIAGVLVVVIYFVMSFWLKTGDVTRWPGELHQMLKVII